MDTQLTSLLSSPSKLSFILFFSIFLLHNSFLFASTTTNEYHYSAAPAPAPAPAVTNLFEFIRSSCNATLYPDICYTSLSRYANYVGRDPAQLARIAIGVSLARARHAAAFISNMTQRADYGPEPRASSALHDCFSVIGEAVDQMRGSLKQMSKIGSLGSGAEAIRFQLSNVQTWMSAALTNEDTCSDGFQDVPDCPVKSDVCAKVDNVKEFTSNALALVNSFAASVGS